MSFQKNQKNVLNAWAFYDWANSVYNLVITSTIFPIFYSAVAVHHKAQVHGEEVGMVEFFGRTFINTELYSYVFSASFLVVVILAPLLSGIADYSGTKKSFLKFFCYLGSISCIALYFFDPAHLEWSMLAVFMASIGFWGSIVFYNAYLPEIATTDMHDRISARGFSMGYIGSVLLLVSVLLAKQAWGMDIRYAFLAVGIWWAGFAQYTYANLPSDIYQREKKIRDKQYLYRGFLELRKVWREVKDNKTITRFLSAYFIYNMGIQTVMLMAVIFASQEINWPIDSATGEKDTSGLIISIILIQLVAIGGAISMSRLSKWWGNVRVLQIAISIWILICVIAYQIHEPSSFYALAAMVGFVMGGSQSLSRSTYSKMLPETEDHASYFSFFDVLEKIGLVIGPACFGLINGFSGQMRLSVLLITGFFVFGLFLLFRLGNNKFHLQTVGE
jgi:UMF1 family MFS transporter